MNDHFLMAMLCLPGFAALALAMDRQQDDVFGRALSPARTRALRVAGWLLLLLALVAAVRTQGWGLGLVAFSGHTSFAAGVVLLCLIGLARWRNRSPRRAMR